MEFSLITPVNNPGLDLRHGDGTVLLGSCFSDNMVPYFSRSGFDVLSNPFGTIFHPMALAEVIESSLKDNSEVSTYQREDLWFSWEASGKIFGYSEEALVACVQDSRILLKEALKSAKLLMITFGTAWGYELESFGTVANCHKAPQEYFSKKLTPVNEMLTRWKSVLQLLKSNNPELQVVFTVSPVRHRKDGLIENNRSKARLIELVAELSSQNAYFPAYEIVMDELRDYRWFKADLVHPNQKAMLYVWERFQEFCCTKETIELIEKVRKVNDQIYHESLYPESISDRKRIENAEQKRGALSRQYPEIYWM